MGKLMLVGAKHFLDLPKGTIYERFWEDDEEDLLKIIEYFKNDKLEIAWNDIEIYGNNGGSMAIDTKEDNYIYYYDANVVGDAYPPDTLYLVIDEERLPKEIEINDKVFTKQDILKIKEKFLTFFDENEPIDNKLDKTNEWARDCLNNEEPYKDNYFVNFKMEMSYDN